MVDSCLACNTRVSTSPFPVNITFRNRCNTKGVTCIRPKKARNAKLQKTVLKPMQIQRTLQNIELKTVRTICIGRSRESVNVRKKTKRRRRKRTRRRARGIGMRSTDPSRDNKWQLCHTISSTLMQTIHQLTPTTTVMSRMPVTTQCRTTRWICSICSSKRAALQDSIRLLYFRMIAGKWGNIPWRSLRIKAQAVYLMCMVQIYLIKTIFTWLTQIKITPV